MVTGRKEILYFILIIFTTYLAGSIPLLLSYKLEPYYTLIITSVLMSLYLMLIYSGNRCAGCDDQENFLFELTPAKICDGGAYMNSTGWKKEFCDKFMSTEEGQKEYVMYNSCPGNGINGPGYTWEKCTGKYKKLKPL
jgi:hypothetical protein